MWGQAAWCIVSSPLVLGLDLTNKTNMAAIWPIITNRESLSINEAWVGDAGTMLKHDTKRIHVPDCPHSGCPPNCPPPPPHSAPDSCHYPTWMVW